MGGFEWYRSYRDGRGLSHPTSARLLREFGRARPHAFFIQVGSNDAAQHDPLRASILRSRWRGIVTEAVPDRFARLQKDYGHFADRITLDDVAIGDRDDSVCLTFESLCEKHRVGRVDLVHVDVGGSELEVVRSIDLARHRPRLLHFEHEHQDAKDRTICRQHIEDHGYETIELGMGTWCLSVDEPAPEERRLVDLWHTVKREGSVSGTSSLRRVVAGRPVVQQVAGRAWRTVKRRVEGERRTELEYWLNQMLGELSPAEWRMLTERYDDTTPLPADADQELANDSTRLRELRSAYKASDLPVAVPSVWNDNLLSAQLDLRHFRGENQYMWHYREWPRAMQLKYFVLTEYVRRRDPSGLLERLGEDGGFGCWTFEYPGLPRVSRDLLDSVNEISFLDRHLGILDRPSLRVLDIGAGYGRTAYRMCQAAAGIDDYCCVDAIPESTFISEYYLRHRGVAPPARVVPLHELDDAARAGHYDLAVNIHSFPECRYDAVAWWLEWLARLDVPHLLIVPNEGSDLLATEPDHTRRDFRPLVDAAGYQLIVDEPVIDDPAVRELLRVHDHFMLFRRQS